MDAGTGKASHPLPRQPSAHVVGQKIQRCTDHFIDMVPVEAFPARLLRGVVLDDRIVDLHAYLFFLYRAVLISEVNPS
jgi:hypothetical protein